MRRLPLDYADQVLDHNRHAFLYGGGSFAFTGTIDVTNPEHVVITLVLQGSRIHFQPATGGKPALLPGQRTVFDRIRCAHWWRDMDKVIVFHHRAAVFPGKSRLLRINV